MDTDIVIVDAPDSSRYEARIAGELVGVLEYRRFAHRITLVHTEIRPDHKGAGVGSLLARFALDDARATGRRVTPVCPFVRRYLERHPEYTDILTRSAGTFTPQDEPR